MEKEYWYKTKKFWVALLFAISLWVYASFNEEYQALVDIPLTITPPSGRSIEDILPSRISVDVAGSGWYLFNYLYINNIKRCKINLNDVRKDDTVYIISSLDMQKGLEGINRVIAKRFYPDQISVRTGEIDSTHVSIIPNVKINLRDGFVLVGNLGTEPQTVTITGNRNLIDTIRTWQTNRLRLNEVNSSFSHTVQVSDSLSSVIDVSPSEITVFASVEQYAEITFSDIEVQVVGGQLPPEHTISPQFFTVTLSGGIELLSKIKSSDISITVNFETIMNDRNGIIRPVVTVPPFTKLMNTEPTFLKHTINVRARNIL